MKRILISHDGLEMVASLRDERQTRVQRTIRIATDSMFKSISDVTHSPWVGVFLLNRQGSTELQSYCR